MVSNTQPLIRKLESIGALSEQDREAVASLPVQVRHLEADEDVVREGDAPSVCCLLLDGFMHGYKVLPDGKRQLLALHTPGDMPDLLRARQEVSESKRWPPSTSPCRFSRRAELHDPTKRLLRYSG